MARIIGDWKRFHSIHNDVLWQDNFFDHRIRNQQEFGEKFQYIEQNPVVKGLCSDSKDWKWSIVNAGVLPEC